MIFTCLSTATVAEAESPYRTSIPVMNSGGMGINFDVSLFGLPGVGSNRGGWFTRHQGWIIRSLRPDQRAMKDFLQKYG
jgi:hypothetical protein